MEINVQNAAITFPLNALGAALLRAAASSIESAQETVSSQTESHVVMVGGESGVEQTQPKRKRRTKAEMEAARRAEAEHLEEELGDDEAEEGDADEELDEIEDQDFGEDEETIEDEPEEKPAPKAAAKKAGASTKAISKETVIEAFKVLAKNDRPRAIEILTKKFKVKSVHDLKPETYPQVLKALRA